jgi:hypothetical protein
MYCISKENNIIMCYIYLENCGCYINNRHLVPSHHIIQQPIYIPSGMIIFIVDVGYLTYFGLY